MSKRELQDRFTGSWRVHALEPSGDKGYTGLVMIRRNGEVFDLDWQITAGIYAGIGLLHDSHLYVGCGENREGLGVAVYNRNTDKTFDVRWSMTQLRGQVGTGKVTSEKADTLEGEHRLTHVGPDNRVVGEWDLRIKKTGDIYELEWRIESGIDIKGLGLETSDGLAVGWYPDFRQSVILDYEPDGSSDERLKARWALGGYTSLGSEALDRETDH